MKARRTYDGTAVVRPMSQVRYNVFTERVANGNRIVRYDTTSVLLASLMFYISIEKMPLDAPKHVILTLKKSK